LIDLVIGRHIEVTAVLIDWTQALEKIFVWAETLSGHGCSDRREMKGVQLYLEVTGWQTLAVGKQKDEVVMAVVNASVGRKDDMAGGRSPCGER